jgi:hypothetical protein
LIKKGSGQGKGKGKGKEAAAESGTERKSMEEDEEVEAVDEETAEEVGALACLPRHLVFIGCCAAEL